jgi:repressor LexA
MSTQDRLSTIKKFYRKYRRLPSYTEMLKLFNLSSKKRYF